MVRRCFMAGLAALATTFGLYNVVLAESYPFYESVKKELEALKRLEKGNVRTVRVESGDTLYSIAQKYDTDVETIAVANDIDNPSVIRAGDRLRIPEEKGVFYRVQAGDTLDSISDAYGTPVNALLAANPFIGEDVKAGQELFIKEPERIPSKQTGVQLATRSRSGAASVQRQGFRYMGLFTLTAYTAGPESTGKRPGDPYYGVTASGSFVQPGVTVAADPRVIPMGSKVYIENVGVRIVQDTGGAIKGNRIDVYIPNLSQARQFGVKKGVKVYLVE